MNDRDHMKLTMNLDEADQEVLLYLDDDFVFALTLTQAEAMGWALLDASQARKPDA